MQLTRQIIEAAFQMHGQVYNDQKLWNIPYHVRCWERANAAFDQELPEEFEWIYVELKNHWQAFRNARSTPWTALRTFDQLRSLDHGWRHKPLHEFRDEDLPQCWRILDSMSGIKPLKYGPSVVAISKFLHFWNPRLFVIVDDAVIWKWVFAHRWLWRPVERMRDHIVEQIGQSRVASTYGACDLVSYLAILRWSADVIRLNPDVGPCFDAHLKQHCPDQTICLPLETYEAAAMEWLLLGLVEVPPPGVQCSDGS